jgi:hypothetical protein
LRLHAFTPVGQRTECAHTSNAGRTVVERILTPREEGRVRYVKHMAKQRIGCGQPLMHGAAHMLLIRDPRSLIPSFDEVTPCTLEATCLPELCCIFRCAP